MVGCSTVQLRDEVCHVQRAHEGEVPCFLAKEPDLLVLRCSTLALFFHSSQQAVELTGILRRRHLVLWARRRAISSRHGCGGVCGEESQEKRLD